MIYDPHEFGPGWYDQRRKRMIAETSAWLTWALRNNIDVPRIPTKRVGRDNTGFSNLLRFAGAKAAVNHWWNRALYTVGSLSSRFQS